MKSMRKALLVTAAALAACGVAGAAAAAIQHSHVVTIRLPHGTQEQIPYLGDTPPEVRLQPAWAPFATAFPSADALAFDAPFVALPRVSAEMDREAAALMQQARSLPIPLSDGAGLTRIDLGKLPPGVTGYSVVSTVSGGKVCTRTTEYGRPDRSGRPRALTRVSGDCNASAAPSSPAPTSVDSQAGAPRFANPMLQEVAARY
jgi:hypothetical protein